MQAQIERAVSALRRGLLVAVPTETVYGLAADATNPTAVAAVFAAKGRPQGHPLIAHLADGDWLEAWAPQAPASAHELARAFWPGPLTLIVPRGPRIPDIVTGGLDTVAMRVPAHDVTRAIIRSLGRPIAAPSANPFGAVSPTTAEHVRVDLGDAVAVIVDGGPCTVGVESTIVDLGEDGPRLVRPGAVTSAELESVLGREVPAAAAGSVAAPGTLAAHYAPRARLKLVEASEVCATANSLVEGGRRVGALVASGDAGGLDEAVARVVLSEGMEELARRLYAALRQLDELGCDVIVAPRVRDEGLGRAIADRLQRAATEDSD